LTSISNIKKNVLSALEDIKAFDIVSIDIRKQASIADYIIIASANSSKQAKALADNIKDRMQKINIPLIGIEGESGNEWV
jgi:ribosome-associated protein